MRARPRVSGDGGDAMFDDLEGREFYEDDLYAWETERYGVGKGFLKSLA